MTLWHLHVMSMHSRHKQRRSGGAKHKEPCSRSTALEPTTSIAVADQDSESDLRAFLHDVLGGWEVPNEEQELFHASLGSNSAPKRTSRKKKKIGAPPPTNAPNGLGGAATFQASPQMHWGMEHSMRQGFPVAAEQVSHRPQWRDNNGMSLGGGYAALGHQGHVAHAFNDSGLGRDQNSAAFAHQANHFFHSPWSNGNASKEEDPSLPLYVQVSRIPGDGML
jgi:hypothetical protein